MNLADIIRELINPTNRLYYGNHGDRDNEDRYACIRIDYDVPTSVRIDDVWMTFYREHKSDPYVAFTIDRILVATCTAKGSVTWEMESPALCGHVTQAAQTLYDRCMLTKTRQDQEAQARINRDRIEKDMNRAALMERFGISK